MLKWVEPFIWKTLNVVGDLMMLAGLLLMLTFFCILTCQGTEFLIEKGVHDEDPN